MAEPEPLEVLASAYWDVHGGGILFGSCGGLEGKLVKVRAGSLVFYVRESLARGHFATSSGVRMAMKRGEKAGAVDVLEVCCPLAAQFDRAAGLVRAHDTMKRPVRRNRNFTARWAEAVLKGRG